MGVDRDDGVALYPISFTAARPERRQADGDGSDVALHDVVDSLAAPGGGPWRTRAELKTAIINWIYWCNENRPPRGEIGDIPPTGCEQFWYAYNPAGPNWQLTRAASSPGWLI